MGVIAARAPRDQFKEWGYDVLKRLVDFITSPDS